MAIVYAKVPLELQEPLLKQLRRKRLRYNLLAFPIVAVLFSALAVMFVFTKAHAAFDLVRGWIGNRVSDGVFWILVAVAVVLTTSTVMAIFLIQMYRECKLEEHLFCSTCTAVDSDDEGICPVCRKHLTESGSFYYTLEKEEQAVLDRYGLVRYRPVEWPTPQEETV